jgi:hypothetical protein
MNTAMTNTMAGTQTAVVDTNTLNRKACLLLEMVLPFSTLRTGIPTNQNLPQPGLALTLVAYAGLLLAFMNAEA